MSAAVHGLFTKLRVPLQDCQILALMAETETRLGHDPCSLYQTIGSKEVVSLSKLQLQGELDLLGGRGGRSNRGGSASDDDRARIRSRQKDQV